MKMANIAFCRYYIVESLYGAHTIMREFMAGRMVLWCAFYMSVLFNAIGGQLVLSIANDVAKCNMQTFKYPVRNNKSLTLPNVLCILRRYEILHLSVKCR